MPYEKQYLKHRPYLDHSKQVQVRIIQVLEVHRLKDPLRMQLLLEALLQILSMQI